jgi:hypothetical protein
MSESENLNIIITNRSPEASQIYPRDPRYYFNDGGTIFLVDGVLFKVRCTSYPEKYQDDRLTCVKLPASLLAPNSSTLSFKPFTSPALVLLDSSDTSTDRSGLNDANPIVVPDITALDFRVLLLALLGR